MYVITAPFEYITNMGEKIEIEVGFVLDFASIPWWVQLIFGYSPIGWYAKPVAIHDKGYKDHNGRTKEWWDDIMVEGMEVMARTITGKITKKYQKDIDRFYRAVSKHGDKAWNKAKG